ncbi:hypothetical protein QBC39DRAFT_396408 [Podospora conica]|nr:hypothetical protein QBC39DRAFT_396408 [Schizothecium conicum]
MSYANGADSLGNATSTSPGNRLGGDGSGPFKMTPVEIAAICIVFALFSAIVALVIYCRVLHQRREADWDNQRRERKRRAQAFFGRQAGGGGGVELADSNIPGKDAAADQPSSASVERLVGGVPLSLPGGAGTPGKGNGSADLEAAVHDGAYVQRKSIWKYVHWRGDRGGVPGRRCSGPDSPPRRSRWARACRRRSETDEEDAPPKNLYV